MVVSLFLVCCSPGTPDRHVTTLVVTDRAPHDGKLVCSERLGSERAPSEERPPEPPAQAPPSRTDSPLPSPEGMGRAMGPPAPLAGSLPGPVVPECAALDWSPVGLAAFSCGPAISLVDTGSMQLVHTLHYSHALSPGSPAQHPGAPGHARPSTAPSAAASSPGSGAGASMASAGPGLPPVTALRFKPAGLGRDATRLGSLHLAAGDGAGRVVLWDAVREEALRWLLPEKASASASGSGTPQGPLGAVAQVEWIEGPPALLAVLYSPTPLVLPSAPPASGGSPVCPVAAPPCAVMIWSVLSGRCVWRFDSSAGEPLVSIACDPLNKRHACVVGLRGLLLDVSVGVYALPQGGGGGGQGPPMAATGTSGTSSGRRPVPFSDRERDEAAPQLQALTVRVHHTQLRLPLPLRGQSSASASAQVQASGRGDGVSGGQASVYGLGNGQGQTAGSVGAQGSGPSPGQGVPSSSSTSQPSSTLGGAGPALASVASSASATSSATSSASQSAQPTDRERDRAAGPPPSSNAATEPVVSSAFSQHTRGMLYVQLPREIIAFDVQFGASVASSALPRNFSRMTRLMLLPTSHALLSMHADGKLSMWQRRRDKHSFQLRDTEPLLPPMGSAAPFPSVLRACVFPQPVSELQKDDEEARGGGSDEGAREEEQEKQASRMGDALSEPDGTLEGLEHEPMAPAGGVRVLRSCGDLFPLEGPLQAQKHHHCAAQATTAGTAKDQGHGFSSGARTGSPGSSCALLCLSEDSKLWHWGLALEAASPPPSPASSSRSTAAGAGLRSEHDADSDASEEQAGQSAKKSAEAEQQMPPHAGPTGKDLGGAQGPGGIVEPAELELKTELQGLFQSLSSRVTTLAVASKCFPGNAAGLPSEQDEEPVLLAVGTAAGAVELVDAASHALVASFAVHPADSPVRGLTWLGASRLVSFSILQMKAGSAAGGAAGGFDNRLVETCVGSGQSRRFRVTKQAEMSEMRALRASPSGRYLLLMFRDSPAEVWAMLHGSAQPQLLRSLALPFSVMEWALPTLAARDFPAGQQPHESPPFGATSSGSIAGSTSPSQPEMPDPGRGLAPGEARTGLAGPAGPSGASHYAAASPRMASPSTPQAAAGLAPATPRSEVAECFSFALVNGSLGVFELRNNRVRDFRPKWPAPSFISDVLVTAMAFRLPYVVLGDKSGSLRWWDVNTGHSASAMPLNRGSIRQILFAPTLVREGRVGRVLLAFQDSSLALFDLDEGQAVPGIGPEMRWRDDKSPGASSSTGPTGASWPSTSGAAVGPGAALSPVLDAQWLPLQGSSAVGPSVAPQLLCAAVADGGIRIWELRTNCPLTPAASRSFRPGSSGLGLPLRSRLPVWRLSRPAPMCSVALMPPGHALAFRLLLQLGVQPWWLQRPIVLDSTPAPPLAGEGSPMPGAGPSPTHSQEDEKQEGAAQGLGGAASRAGDLRSFLLPHAAAVCGLADSDWDATDQGPWPLADSGATGGGTEPSAPSSPGWVRPALPAIGEPGVPEVLLKALHPLRLEGRLMETDVARHYAATCHRGFAARCAFAAAHFGDLQEANFWLLLPRALSLLALGSAGPQSFWGPQSLPESQSEASGDTRAAVREGSSSGSLDPTSRDATKNKSTLSAVDSGMEEDVEEWGDPWAVRQRALQRLGWHTTIGGTQANQRRVHECVLVGDYEGAVTLLLSTPWDQPEFYADAMRAVALATAVSPAMRNLAVKVVATNMVLADQPLVAAQMLCSIGHCVEACSQLQAVGRWVDASVLAATHLCGADRAQVLRKWARHTLMQEQDLWRAIGDFEKLYHRVRCNSHLAPHNPHCLLLSNSRQLQYLHHRAMSLFLAAGCLTEALAALRSANQADTAMMLLLACHEEIYKETLMRSMQSWPSSLNFNGGWHIYVPRLLIKTKIQHSGTYSSTW